MKIQILLPGTPQAKARHRSAKNKRGKSLTYDPQWEDKITTQWKMKAQTVGSDLAELSEKRLVSVQVLFELPIPASKKKSIKQASPHTKKPDVDNLLKYVMDCGNGILWSDDSKIYSTTAVKVYSDTPQTLIVVDYGDPAALDELTSLTELHGGWSSYLRREWK